MIILPGGNRRTKEFVKFCIRILGLNADQVLWTTGKSYLMDDDIRKELLPEIWRRLRAGRWEIIPYSVTKPFLSWASRFAVPVFGDQEQWVRIYSNKGILHPNAIAKLRQAGLPLLPAQVAGLRVPRGYTCTTREELALAYDLLTADGVKRFVLKPVVGTTGEGIRKIDSKRQIARYTFRMGAVVLEECLKIDTDKHGGVVSPSIQYFAGKILDGLTDQTFKGVAYEGNTMPSATSYEFQKGLLTMAGRVLRWLKPQGPGGFDFLSVDGRPVLVDPNVGRFTGAHPARIFGGLYAPQRPFVCWKVEPKRCVEEFWNRLLARGIAFTPGTSHAGVFPLCYLPRMWGLLVAFGKNRKELTRLRRQAEKCL